MKKVLLAAGVIILGAFFSFGYLLYKVGEEMTTMHRCGLDLCQYFGQKKSKDYAAFLSSSSSFCCGVK